MELRLNSKYQNSFYFRLLSTMFSQNLLTFSSPNVNVNAIVKHFTFSKNLKGMLGGVRNEREEISICE
jgi:hypothetical protein